MFNFIEMDGTYDDRKVGRYDNGGVSVSTARVNDGRKPFETAIRHPYYNSGRWVVVECYDTKEEAEHGHEKWIEVITTEPLPDKLVDCANSMISQLGDVVGLEMEFPKENNND